MKTQITLLLICVFFTKTLSLKCHQCLPSESGGCITSTDLDCPGSCASATISVFTSGTKLPDISIKTCGVPGLCLNESLNIGTLKLTRNGQCCSTDLCNSQILPALPLQPINGRMCQSCDDNNCSKTLNCEGIEDRCVTASVELGGNKSSVKGCVSKNLCETAESLSREGIVITNVKCCEGNLCNGAESFTLSFLLMMVPLLSSILFF